MAYAAGRAANGGQGQDDNADEQQQQVPAAPPPPAPTSGNTDVEELQKLAQLHEAGALTDDEFASEKAKVLGA